MPHWARLGAAKTPKRATRRHAAMVRHKLMCGLWHEGRSSPLATSSSTPHRHQQHAGGITLLVKLDSKLRCFYVVSTDCLMKPYSDRLANESVHEKKFIKTIHWEPDSKARHEKTPVSQTPMKVTPVESRIQKYLVLVTQ
jgi:hypothetical protein